MINFKHDIKQVHFNELKRRVESQFGHELVNTNHSNLLHQEILNTTNKSLSASTITRMFVSSTYNNIPYLNTLDILSEYATGKTWGDFCKSENAFDTTRGAQLDDGTYKLLEICLQNEDFKSVLDYIKFLPGSFKESSYESRLKLSNLLGVSIRNTEHKLAFTKELAKTKQGRFLFYENFVDIDNLTGYYGEALDYYEQYGQSVNPRKRKNDFIFIKAMRFWQAWLMQDIDKLRKVGFELFNNYEPMEMCNTDDIHFYPMARWHAYRLIYLKYANKLNGKIVEETIQTVEILIIRFGSHPTKVLLSKLFEALLITGYSQYIYPLFLKHNKKIENEAADNDTYLPLLQYVKLAFIKNGGSQLAESIILPNIQLDLLTNRATYARLCNQFSV